MSIENEIAGLTQSTTDLLEAVNTKKATLDTAVSNAQTAVTDATSQVSLAAAEKVGAQTARDTAESFKDQAYTYSQSAASAVAYQDLTAIAETKAESAVDVFVYDTSKDSDGGAWRKRTQHTSWYNETLNTATRGSRKEFPAVAVITIEYNGNAENTDVMTIYDGDDPSLPMWMVFKRGGGVGSGVTRKMIPGVSNVSAIHAVNGTLCVTSAEPNRGGAHTVSFINDSGFHYSGVSFSGTNNANIAQRNTGLASVVDNSKGLLVNSYINDVAMTVLPNAPIDPATGLPIPTIAVATNGGVSVIKDDGTVVDIIHYSATYSVVKTVSFDDSNNIIIESDDASRARRGFVVQIPSGDDTFADLSSYPIAPSVVGYGSSTDTTDGSYNGNLIGQSIGEVCKAGDDIAVFSDTSKGLSFADYSDTSTRGSLLAYITSKYNTGWMNGDIKLATLSDTDDTDLVATELVTNGTFDTDTTGWGSVNGSSVITLDNGRLKATKTASGSSTWMARGSNVLSTEVGKQYLLKADISRDPSNTSIQEPRLILWDTATTTTIDAVNKDQIAQGFTFTALSTGRTEPILVQSGGAIAGDVFYIDNVSCVELEPDRSVNNNGLQVFGTVQRSPVATGADLVAYSGFSTSNYLEQPYNPDLDFGTGDFCVMGWVNSDYASNKHLFAIVDGQGSSWGLNGFIAVKYDSSTSKLQFILAGGMLSTVTPTANTWQHVCLLRKTGVLYAYLDGKLVGSQINTNNLGATTADSKLYLGTGVFNGNVLFNDNSKQALWRVSKTAPTAEQIKKIYEDEKVLFQENAKATLHGTSDAVTALAYDDTTELLHVGTSAGRSVFQGLRRVDNTTDAVGVAISASNNLIVEE